MFAAANVDDINRAIAIIKGITAIPELGEVYEGK
jgi:polyribonucleotide nucleotidyltransferase